MGKMKLNKDKYEQRQDLLTGLVGHWKSNKNIVIKKAWYAYKMQSATIFQIYAATVLRRLGPGALGRNFSFFEKIKSGILGPILAVFGKKQ